MGKYDKYVIREPNVVCVDYHPTDNVKGVTFPDEVWLDNTMLNQLLLQERWGLASYTKHPVGIKFLF